MPPNQGVGVRPAVAGRGALAGPWAWGLEVAACAAGAGLKPFEGLSSRTPHFLFFFAKKKRKRAVHGPKEKKTPWAYGGAWVESVSTDTRGTRVLGG